MIKGSNPHELAKSALFSKSDYASYYKSSKEPEPELRSNVNEVGLDDDIMNYFKQNAISYFYRFEEEGIGEIIFGNNVLNVAFDETPVAVMTTSKQIAESYRRCFYNMWKVAKTEG